MGSDFPGWLALEAPPEPSETLSSALLDPLGLVLGPWSLVPGPWSMVLGPWCLVPGPWSLLPGPWSVVLGLLVPGSWYHVLEFGNIVLS